MDWTAGIFHDLQTLALVQLSFRLSLENILLKMERSVDKDSIMHVSAIMCKGQS